MAIRFWLGLGLAAGAETEKKQKMRKLGPGVSDLGFDWMARRENLVPNGTYQRTESSTGTRNGAGAWCVVLLVLVLEDASEMGSAVKVRRFTSTHCVPFCVHRYRS